MEKNEYGRRVWDVEAAAAAAAGGEVKRRKGDNSGDDAWFTCKECGERFKDTLALARHSGLRHKRVIDEGEITLAKVQAFVKSL